MSLEDEFVTYLKSDAILVSILTGGIYARGTVGRDGITSRSAPSAFDSYNDLKPVAMVKQRDLVPDGMVADQIAQHVSARQVIEIWLYEESGYTHIDAALNRLHVLLFGYQFGYYGFPAEWVNTINREKDEGALDGASLARQDWAISIIIGQGAV